ncbi:NAD-dependent epimerase/dehydratase family protein [Hydromonas duriensis]|uniref:Uncharacterized protein YbjT (DUF2867 family) n=1 Tax=Hydromonas duriensis TaxID=1527608 RepID=A0A4R6YAI0_9BURK|nr:NAD-dependent epimerase/dehydratase family protein [Hydromonas duriensis]TDR32532.1 uncharacterized protein YbjT (DUF2867 family) [Hydromonas duriensis]
MSIKPQKVALIVGATGLVGRLLLNRLLESDTYGQVIVLTRRELGRTHPKLIEFKVDFDALPTLGIPVDDVFCSLGTTIKAAGSQEAFYQVDCVYPHAVAKWAQKHGARQVLMVTALGASVTSNVFYNRVKGEVERKVIALKLPTTVIVRPSLILGERQERRVMERLAQSLAPLLNRFLIGPLKKYQAIHAEQVARALVSLAQKNYYGVRIVESDVLRILK